ncbi:MAG: NYN domain-containing protein [Eggerthellaceae bacterium]
MDKRFALLIDADNVSAKYIKPILEELSKYGTVTYKRIYGDWTNTQNGKWKDELLNSSITPIQQFGYTQGKNATDSAMIIDAMDILYTNSVEGFCLVSSDSDFTKLASRIRESGLTVIGMGEKKTPQPFRKACDIFTVLNLLMEEAALGKEEPRRAAKEDAAEGPQTVPPEKIESAVVKIILDNQNNNKETGLGEVGSRLVKRYPDFDVRSYGYSLLSRLLEEFPRVQTIKEGNTLYVALNDAQVAEEDPAAFIRRTVVAAGRSGIDLAVLGKKVKNEYKGFKVRDSGYSQFKQYVKSLDDIVVSEGENGLCAVALD